MDKPKTFLGTPPTPQHAMVAEEIKAHEEAEKREEKKIEETIIAKEAIQEAESKPFLWWVQTIMFWGMLVYVITTIFIVPRAFKYTNETKENTDEFAILKQWEKEQIKKGKEERKSLLCSKVDESEECKDAKPLPTGTPTPTVKISYPTP
jgi:type IV secretory pathway component VirB8